SCIDLSFFYFFQAEDGIRDFHVTGVQTCALPILVWVLSSSASRNSLVLSCCSTPVNCTSCWVNWLVSSGSSGFWFRSCVVRIWRNMSKFSAIVCRDDAIELDPVETTPLTAILYSYTNRLMPPGVAAPR